MATTTNLEGYRRAVADWHRAIDDRLPHLVISARWEVVRIAAAKIGVVPGVPA